MQGQSFQNIKEPLPESFKDKAAIVSALLKEAALKPRIYIRQKDGDIKPAKYAKSLTHKDMKDVFSDYKKNSVLTDKFDTPLGWPEIDFVYDSQLQAVFAEGGKYTLKFVDDQQDKGDLYLYYHLQDQEAEYLITGYKERLKTRHGGKDRIENFGMDALQYWEGSSNANIPQDKIFKLVAVSIIGMPLIFSKWETSSSGFTSRNIVARTAVVGTAAKESMLGIKGEHPLYYRLYVEPIHKVNQT